MRVVQKIPHTTGGSCNTTGGSCRGDPVGRPWCAHARQRRRVTWGHRARSHQGDAPRRPYVPCVQPRALHQRTSQHTRRTSGRGREDRLSRSPHPSEPCRRGSRTQLSGRWFTYTKDWQFRTWAVAEERNFGHARKFAQLEGGLLPEETVGGQIRPGGRSRRGQQRTNISPSRQAAPSNAPGKCQPRIRRVRRPTASTLYSAPAKFCACPEISWYGCVMTT
jgi:hypothetical protein